MRESEPESTNLPDDVLLLYVLDVGNEQSSTGWTYLGRDRFIDQSARKVYFKEGCWKFARFDEVVTRSLHNTKRERERVKLSWLSQTFKV